MKEVNNDEHFALINAPITHRKQGGKPSKPIKMTVGNIPTEFSEWSRMFDASSTLERLILVANLYLKLSRIWNVILKPYSLRAYYCWCRAFLSCLTRCCNNGLIEFTTRWGNPFKHFHFFRLCCPAGDKTGTMCGSVFKSRNQVRSDGIVMRSLECNYHQLRHPSSTEIPSTIRDDLLLDQVDPDSDLVKKPRCKRRRD